jgi:sodium/potassium-transporting ATPase subunit beta
MLGLGFRPMPPESNVESTLIWYRGNDEQNYKYWTDELDKFLEGKQNYLYSTFDCITTNNSVFL